VFAIRNMLSGVVVLLSIMECCGVLWSVVECCGVLSSVVGLVFLVRSFKVFWSVRCYGVVKYCGMF